jgi:hypothetical protein
VLKSLKSSGCSEGSWCEDAVLLLPEIEEGDFDLAGICAEWQGGC